MTTIEKFQDLVFDYIKNYKFDELYDKIDLLETYTPSEIIELIEYTIFYLEMKGRNEQCVISTILYYKNIIEGHDEHKRYLSKLEALYLVYRLDSVINKAKSSDKLPNFYL